MNTKSSNKDYTDIQNSFDEIFSFNGNYDDQIENDAHLIMAKFLSEIEKTMAEKKILRKTLAKKIGTSASFLTQLFRGHKLINLITLAKIQRELEIEFNISATDNNVRVVKHSSPPSVSSEMFIKIMENKPQRMTVVHRNWVKNNPEYDSFDFNLSPSIVAL